MNTTTTAPSPAQRRLLLALVVAEGALDEVIDELRRQPPSVPRNEYALSWLRHTLPKMVQAAGPDGSVERVAPEAERLLDQLLAEGR